MKSIIHYTLIGILLFSIYGSLELSIVDFNQKDVCPKLLGVPACYLVLLFFSLGLISQVFQNRSGFTFLFFIVIGITFSIALNGTVTELSGIEICPRTAGGTPMCFISLGLCTTLLVLKTISIFTKRSMIK